jgi:protein-tyrosine phosphatase
MYSLLFICTGNLCRSPMAAALFTHRLQKEEPDWTDWRVESAGTWTVNNQPAATEAIKVMSMRGLDISQHRSREVTAELMREYDLILTMEAGQKEALQVEFPFLSKQIYLLSEMSGVKVDVPDPFGKSTTIFEDTADKIDRYIKRGLLQIIKRIKQSRLDETSTINT